jgi:hypothetical protein
MGRQLEPLKKSLVNKNNKKIATISFTIERLKNSDPAESSREQGHDTDVSNKNWNETSTQLQAIAGAATGAVAVAKEVASIYGPWQPLAEKIQIVVAIGDTISEVSLSLKCSGFNAHLSFISRFIRMLSWRGVPSHLLFKFVSLT